MGMKKAIKSEGMYVVSDAGGATKFPPGFSYRLDRVIYTVQERVTKDAASEMRLVKNSDGDIEVMPIESIQMDLRLPYAKVLSKGMIPVADIKAEEKVEEKSDVKPEKK